MGVKQLSKSLSARKSDLSDTLVQLKVLSGRDLRAQSYPSFVDKVHDLKGGALKPTEIGIFQLNIGKLCNQTCGHCHVDAGPDKKRENMDKATLQRCLEIIASLPSIHTVDITGGAPEMNPHFRWFVEELRKLDKVILNRCNLTIIQANKKYHDLPQFFKDNEVVVVSSLPYFSQSRTDSQRGQGVFEDSIKSLQQLNEVGYGIEGSGLKLDLVYNPSGAFLPASQVTLEAEFKRQLNRKYNIHFNSLYAITNIPISRFMDYLLESGNYDEYMQKLVDAYNPMTVDSVMCRNTISISWDGYIYDCDFNQMLDVKVNGKSKHINDFDAEELMSRDIVLNQHCYGCTAGAGSSCGGTIE